MNDDKFAINLSLPLLIWIIYQYRIGIHRSAKFARICTEKAATRSPMARKTEESGIVMRAN